MATNSSIYGSDETYFQDCDICKFQNLTSEAVSYCNICSEYMCTVCQNVHRGSKLTKNHKLLTGSNLPFASTMTKQTSPIMFCEDHTTLIVNMYCKSHDEVICSACKITSHRTCQITDVSEQTKQMKTDGSFNKTKTHLEDLKSQYDGMNAMRKKDKSRSTSQLNKCLDDMRQIRKEFNETLDTIVNALSKEIQHVDEKTTKDTEGHIAICDDVLSQIKEKLKNLKESEKTQDDQVMFVGMKRALIAQHKYADTMAKIQQDMFQTETEFKINDSLYGSLKQLQSVETVLFDKQSIGAGITYGRQSEKSLLSMSISGGHVIEVKNTFVSGCTFMPDGHLVLCCGGNGLKLLDKYFKINSQLTGRSLNVAAINDNEIIVTQGIDEQIQKVTIFPKMEVSKTMKMDRPCYGVDVYGDEIYVTCKDRGGGNGEVQVLNMKGQVQRRLGLNNGKYMFTHPDYATISNDGSKVFVSDWGTQTVTCLDTQGHVIYQYSDQGLKEPQGMYVDCAGYLFVCDIGINNVHVIGQHGRTEKSVLLKAGNVIRPWCIAFDKRAGCLVVGMNQTSIPLISYTAK